MASVPAYQASGLASNMDTQGIIEKLVAIEGQPLTTIATKQAAITVKISSIGTLMSNLEALSTQAKFLKTNGISAVAVNGTYSDFSVAGTPANPGRYDVKVQDLARAAKARSTTVYTSADDVVTATAKNLKLSVDGTTHSIAVTAGTTLSQLVTQINGANKPFTASLVSDGSQYYVTLTRKETGFVVGQPASSALSVVNEGGIDQDLGLGLSSPADLQAKNAVVYVDGLRIERKNNEITDVVPGTTLSLKAASNTNVDLVFNADSASSAGMLGSLVNNYNKVAAFLKGQMDSDPKARQVGDKLGSSVAYGMMRQMEKIVGAEVNTTGAIRTLRDLGVKLQKDGSLKLDSAVLTAALAKDPSAVNTIFNKSGTGLGDTIANFVYSQTNTTTSNNTTGMLVSRRASLEKGTKALTLQAERLTTHLDAYRRQLNIQFTALENVMNGVNGIAKFLDAQDAQLRKK
jgi:flagellar hook-associated protein 2